MIRWTSAGQGRGRIALFAAAALGASLTAVPGAVAAEQCFVAKSMIAAGDHWVAHGTDLAGNSWQNGTFHVGNLALVRTTGVSNHKTLPWAQDNGYLLQSDPSRPFFPDFQAAGEAYLDLYSFHPDALVIADVRKRVADEVASVERGDAAYWDYVDALNMAMPSLARIGVMDGSEPTLAAMRKLFRSAEKRLFDDGLGLWRRDAGSDAYWSRGNGWALAALAKVLQVLPSGDSRRPELLRVFEKMANTLWFLQRRDGFWNTDLLRPWNHGGPESSGTALFTFGLAWGVNAGILDAGKYRPTVDKAWEALSTKALRADGFLGYVQPVASGPGPARAGDTAAYGVGAFLIAGQQMARLTPGC
ncbi:glycoside hydrolase family 88 protein [Amycolatopsis sp. NPDC089917]|uniref:glycoside hydrolase family 88 protein n=1 Tax=Amycolatopsis sp. NPDC089917 TaxID=3155187 RepID=UPI0034459C0C